MKIVRCLNGFKVINIKTQKEMYKSFSLIDCEQYIFAKNEIWASRRAR